MTRAEIRIAAAKRHAKAASQVTDGDSHEI